MNKKIILLMLLASTVSFTFAQIPAPKNDGNPPNGICDTGEDSSSLDCNGVCDEFDSPGSPDCNGICDVGENSSSSDCNGICDVGESSSSSDCNGVCDAGESSSSSDCNGICSPGETGSDCDGICDQFDNPGSPDCNGICDVGESSSSADCNGNCEPGEVSNSPDCFGDCNPSTLFLSTNAACELSRSGSTFSATNRPGSFCNTSSAQADYFEFTATESTSYTVEISNSAEVLSLSVFDDCGLASSLACGVSTVDVALVQGSTYVIAAYIDGVYVPTTFEICIYIPADYSSGNVGILTKTPQTRLDVNGGIKPGFTNNAVPGNIRWNQDLEVYNGTEWKSITSWDHIATQNIDMQGNSITNLSTPVLPSDAVTKDYVDNSGDADSDPNNEFQTLNQNSNLVTLSNGGGTVNVGDIDNANEIQTLSQSGNTITLSQSGGSFSISDGDNDDSNEFQTLTQTGNQVMLSNGGGIVNVGDIDNANEIQTLSQSGNTITLSQSGGSFSISDGDDDDSNEFQTLNQNSNLVTLSNGGGTVNVGDIDNTNEIQTLSQNGNQVTLSGAGGTININDADADSDNETISSANLLGTTLRIIEAGSTFDVGLSNIATQWSNNGSEIYYNASVGIGTSDPTERLDVRGTTQIRMNSSGNSPQLQLVETGASDGARIDFQSSIETNNTWTLFGRADNTLANNSFNLFHTGSGNILQVRGNGDVGINGSPDSELHIFHGNSGTSDGLILENTGSASPFPWWRLYVSSSSSDLRLFSRTQGNTVVGAFDDITGVYSNISDVRLKKNVRELSFDWQSFMSLNPYSYALLNQDSTERSIGLMAQDVLKVYPELVTYIKENDQYLMNYSGLSVVAIKAAQEQQKRIVELEAENESIKQELAEIRQILKQLNAK